MIIEEFKIKQDTPEWFSDISIALFEDKDPDLKGLIFTDEDKGMSLFFSTDKLDELISILTEIKSSLP